MLTADSGIASRRRLRDGAGAGGTAALGLFVSGLARTSIVENSAWLVSRRWRKRRNRCRRAGSQWDVQGWR